METLKSSPLPSSHRSAKEFEERMKKESMKGNEVPKEQNFDSNCITPGAKGHSVLIIQ